MTAPGGVGPMDLAQWSATPVRSRPWRAGVGGRRQHLLRSLGGVPRPEAHRHCPGRWRAVVSLKPGPDGQRRRKKVSGKNKTEVRAKLAELHDELNDGVVTNAGYTVAQAIKDWLADGLAGCCMGLEVLSDQVL